MYIYVYIYIYNGGAREERPCVLLWSAVLSFEKRGRRAGICFFKGALQLLSKRYGYIHFAQVPERVFE